jgi:NADP-dependent aldehyde dehydrogenase
MSIATEQFIAGTRSQRGKATFNAEQAGTGKSLSIAFAEATPEEIDLACVKAAHAAPVWANTSLAKRADLLDAIATELESRADAFVEQAGAETGLPEARIRGELGRTSGQLRLFAGVVREGAFLGVRIDHGDPDRAPAPKPDLRQYQIPLGPVGVFGASNFPLAFSVCGGDTASALAAGCPVVVKAHPAHPGTSAIAAEAVESAVANLEVPAGVFSMLQGSSHALGAALVQHSAIQAIGFTGSQRGGLALQALAQSRAVPIPVYAEMGSVNPLFILPGALSERAEAIAEGLAGSITMGCGQFCTKPGLVFVPRSDALSSFNDALSAKLQSLPANAMLHSGILAAYEQGCHVLDQADGVERLAAGEEKAGLAQAKAYITNETTFLANPALAEEIFGPVTLIIAMDDPAQATTLADALQGQLTAGIHLSQSDIAIAEPLIERLQQKAGRILANGYPTGVEVGEAMVHGGPYPATTDSRTTSVGTRAIERFLRPLALQDMPDALLPAALREANPLGLPRRVDGAPQPRQA